ncbi:MAG TPA: CBS domain-containing protein [Candidatus Saccharimonadales bacterium]|nr:CBS domain-containing protein [Candidatus Saccharimonadales bacterium]
MVSSVVPRRAKLSRFELERRQGAGDASAEQALRREATLGDVLSVQRVLSALFLVLFVALAVAALGWLWGILLAVVVALEYAALARMPIIHTNAQKLYEQYEAKILRFISDHEVIFKLFRSVSTSPSDAALDSREELAYLVENSGQLLSADEKKLILHGLEFNSRQVSEVMTPRGVIDSIGKNELLGPLVLDSLHKTGHSRFPVTDGDIDHVVGVLHIQDLFTLDSKHRSTTVEKTMEARVFYIREDQTLERALAAFLRTRHHLFVVVNEFRETVGHLSLEDVIEALLGRKIMDEFDMHDDLRAVAARNPRGNNEPQKHEDI